MPTPIDQTKFCARCGAYMTAKEDGGEHHVARRTNDRDWVKRLCFDCHRLVTDNNMAEKEFKSQYEQCDWDEEFKDML